MNLPIGHDHVAVHRHLQSRLHGTSHVPGGDLQRGDSRMSPLRTPAYPEQHRSGAAGPGGESQTRSISAPICPRYAGGALHDSLTKNSQYSSTLTKTNPSELSSTLKLIFAKSHSRLILCRQSVIPKSLKIVHRIGRGAVPRGEGAFGT